MNKMEKHWLLNQFDLVMDIINHIKSYTIFINSSNLKNIVTTPFIENFIYSHTIIVIKNGEIVNIYFKYKHQYQSNLIIIDFVKSYINPKYIKLYSYDYIEYCFNTFKYQKVNELTIDGFYYIYGNVVMYC